MARDPHVQSRASAEPAVDDDDDAPTYRCWICLDDERDLNSMISPCACVGTNQWVHEACLKTYCLQRLSTTESLTPTLDVSCPICKTRYDIIPTGDSSSTSTYSSWRELLGWTSTDRALLLRHVRFLLLVGPLVCSALLAWSWLLAYWEDLYLNGPGEMLMDGSETPGGGPPMLRGAMRWVPANAITLLQKLPGLAASFEEEAEAAVALPADADAAPPSLADAADDASASGLAPHPAGISRKWSLMYVWLQYVQWYKILSWLFVLVAGGSEGVLPPGVREMFRVDELLFAVDVRGSIFVIGQCFPFACCKLRHFLVTWAPPEPRTVPGPTARPACQTLLPDPRARSPCIRCSVHRPRHCTACA